MKKGKHYRYEPKKPMFRKKISLVAVSFLLVLLTGVSATFSWIEDVSQVEFSSTDGQETPLHIGSKILYSDAVMKYPNQTVPQVNLNEYFNQSGDMHLSPCFSNGEDFYFPVERGSGYRVGTKDDANVNYLSVTFRVRSEGAATAYWFEKSGTTAYVTFKDGSTADNSLANNLRCSITVDGATNVYAVGGNTYRTIINNEVIAETGRNMNDYMYYAEAYNNNAPEGYYKNNANITNKPNQGGGNNLNGNTLFTVNKYDDANKANTIKTVTLKLWLEGDANGTAPISGVDLSSINLNIVSGWEKTRRIYVKDSTVHQVGYSQAKWLSHNGSANVADGLLYWAIKGQEDALHWKMTRVSATSQFYYVDIPAVYNNVAATLCRRSGTTWEGSSTWDYWDTTFPNTFHSETFTVYSKEFGTWEPAENVHCVYFTNSAFFNNVYDYMWDSNSVHGSGINDKVVKNAEWPGLQMTTKMDAKIHGLDVYAFFYNSDYDRIIFNDGDLVTGANQEYQTQDLWLTNSSGTPLQIVGGTFDMATLTWFHTNPTATDWTTKMPTYSAANTYLEGNFSTNNAWKKTRFAYGGEYSSTNGDAMNGTTANNMIAKVYIKNAGDFQFVVHYNGKCYKTWDENENLNLYNGGHVDMYQEGGNNDSNVIAKDLQKDVYRFYLQPIANDGIRIYLQKGEAHNTN